MSTESKAKAPIKIMVLDRARKLAEAWVNNMSPSDSLEETFVELEGRPERLGLGAKIAPKVKAAVSTDAVERKLLGILNKKKKPYEDEEETGSVKEKASSEDDENEPESRTRAFVKKKPMPQATPLQSKKARK